MTERRPGEQRRQSSRAAALLALAVQPKGGLSACPESEQILAWHEESLATEAAARIEAHVARCEHCYALWTGLLRTGPSELTAPKLRWWQRFAFLGNLGNLGNAGRPRRLAASLAGALVAGVAIIAVINVMLVDGPASIPVPGYELSIQGKAVVRGSEPAAGDDIVRLANGNRFSVVLRPETSLDEPVAARASLLESGQLRSLQAPPARLLARGVVVFEGTVGTDVLLPEGRSTLLFVAGRAAAMPPDADVLARLADDHRISTDDWHAWRIEVIRD